MLGFKLPCHSARQVEHSREGKLHAHERPDLCAPNGLPGVSFFLCSGGLHSPLRSTLEVLLLLSAAALGFLAKAYQWPEAVATFLGTSRVLRWAVERAPVSLCTDRNEPDMR